MQVAASVIIIVLFCGFCVARLSTREAAGIASVGGG